MKAIPALLCLTGAALSLSGCFPTKDFAQFPDVNAITVRKEADGRYVAVPPDCEALLQPSQYNSANNLRPDIAFGCATLTNLAAQVANPQDLVAPSKPYSGQHADTAGSAVTRYREDKVIELNNTMTTSKSGGGR